MDKSIEVIARGQTDPALEMKKAKIPAGFAGQDFGMTRETPAKWPNWYKLNQAKLAVEDADRLAASIESAGKGK